MNIVVTGAEGFLGWHLSSRLKATRGIDPVRVGRTGFRNGLLTQAVARADLMIHLAGVNRASSDDEVEQGNVELARELAQAISAARRPLHVVYANSSQADNDTAYGRGKTKAAVVLKGALEAAEGSLTDVLLPNIFGEHGRPHYNSFVATFCHELAKGRRPEITSDRDISLLHAQRAAEVMISAGERRDTGRIEPPATSRRISEVLARLGEFKVLYDNGEIPDLGTPFAVDLFNTYRSFTFPSQFPHSPTPHDDARGRLFETVRMHGGKGQAFVSTTRPGATRGDHYHLQKFERFFVLSGEAEIGLRRLFTKEIQTFRLSGDRPAFVDMPTMWVHNIRNVGHGELLTMFWSNQLLDPDKPDQYAEKVNPEEEAT